MEKIDSFKIRAATWEDVKIIFELSNDSVVRQNSINKDLISWDNHIDWFQKKLRDVNYIIYLIFCKNVFVGQTKFEIDNDKAIVSISIDTAFRGKKIASRILQLACEKLFHDFKEIKNVFAYIKPENVPSIRSFHKAGFIKLDQDTIIAAHRYFVFSKTPNE